MLCTRPAPFAPRMQDDFGVGRRAKPVALQLKFLAQFPKIEDFPIEGDAGCAIRGEHRLIAGHQIDDRKAAMTKGDTRPEIEPLTIRAAMNEGIVHRLDLCPVRYTFAGNIEPATDAAHIEFRPATADAPSPVAIATADRSSQTAHATACFAHHSA